MMTRDWCFLLKVIHGSKNRNPAAITARIGTITGIVSRSPTCAVAEDVVLVDSGRALGHAVEIIIFPVAALVGVGGPVSGGMSERNPMHC